MNFFDNLSDTPRNPDQRGQIHPQIRPANSLKMLLELYGCIAMERQLILKGLIDTKSWTFDRDMCVLRFEPDLLLDARVLGAFTPEQQKWMWSWSNAFNIFTDRAKEHAEQLRSYGAENKIDAFIMDSLPANQLLATKFGLIAAILCRTSGYFFVPREPTLILVTVHSPVLNITPPDDDDHLNWITSQFMAIFKVHGKTAIANYLSLKNFQVNVLDNSLTAVKENKNILVEFDKVGKLLRFNEKAPSFGN